MSSYLNTLFARQQAYESARRNAAQQLQEKQRFDSEAVNEKSLATMQQVLNAQEKELERHRKQAETKGRVAGALGREQAPGRYAERAGSEYDVGYDVGRLDADEADRATQEKLAAQNMKGWMAEDLERERQGGRMVKQEDQQAANLERDQAKFAAQARMLRARIKADPRLMLDPAVIMAEKLVRAAALSPQIPGLSPEKDLGMREALDKFKKAIDAAEGKGIVTKGTDVSVEVPIKPQPGPLPKSAAELAAEKEALRNAAFNNP